MRPRKRILLTAITDGHTDTYRLLLQTWGYAIAAPGDEISAVLAVELPAEQIPSLVAQHDPARVIARVRHQVDCPIATDLGAHSAAADNTTLRQCLRVATAFKRGPKRIAVSAEVTTHTQEL